MLEQLAPEKDKENGHDLADFIIKQDWRLYRQQPKLEPEQLPQVEVFKFEPTQNTDFSFKKPLASLRKDWKEINRKILKFEPIEYNNIVIQDPYKFIEYQFELLQTKTDNPDYLPLLKRRSDILFDLWVEVIYPLLKQCLDYYHRFYQKQSVLVRMLFL